MLKKFILGCAALAFTVAAVAQEGKPRMYINNFTFAEGVTEANGTAVYQAVIAGINSTKRFEVATEGMESALSQEIARRSSEAAMHDAKTRNEVLMAAGCQYVMDGNVIKCDIETTVLEDGSVDRLAGDHAGRGLVEVGDVLVGEVLNLEDLAQVPVVLLHTVDICLSSL